MKFGFAFLSALSLSEVEAVTNLQYNNKFRRKQQSLDNVTVVPSTVPSVQPSQSVTPSSASSSLPSIALSNKPTLNDQTTNPSSSQSPSTSKSPSSQPSQSPSSAPSLTPSYSPTYELSKAPSSTPTNADSSEPSMTPSSKPTVQTSSTPSASPTLTPTSYPSYIPSPSPSYTIRTNPILDLEMILEGMNEEMESTATQDLWRQITSNQVQVFWESSENVQKSVRTSNDETIMNDNDGDGDNAYSIDVINTFILRQDIITLKQGGIKAGNSNDVISALRIQYYQEVSHRLGPEIKFPTEFSIQPFEAENDKKKYIEELKLMDTIFQSITDSTVREMILDSSPTWSPTKQPSKSPSNVNNPETNRQSNAIIAWTSVLACLIVTMAILSIWFFYVYNRDDDQNTNRQFINICLWKRKRDEENPVISLLATSQNDSGKRRFPIQFMPSENDDKEDDPSVIFIQQDDNLKHTPLVENQSNLSNIVSEGSSQKSKISEEGDEASLKESLIEHGQDQQ